MLIRGSPNCAISECNCKNESKIVNCTGHGLIDLTAGRLKNVYLELLEMSATEITHLHVDAFTEVRGIRHLKLNNNSISVISAATLAPLRNVTQRIDLSANNISTIENSTFANFSQLVRLDLSSNLIESIDHDAFLDCAQLQYLYLFNNSLKRIPARLFFSLVKLELVDVHSQRSPMLTIDDYAFERDKLSASVRIILGNGTGIQLGSRAFCSRNNNNANTSPFATIDNINYKQNRSRLSDTNVCLFQQLKRNGVEIIMDDDEMRRPSCECETLSIEEENLFCLSRRELTCRTTATTTTTATTITSTSTTTIVTTITTSTILTISTTTDQVKATSTIRTKSFTFVASTNATHTTTTPTTTTISTTTTATRPEKVTTIATTTTTTTTTKTTTYTTGKLMLVVCVYILLLLSFLILCVNFSLKVIVRLLLLYVN